MPGSGAGVVPGRGNGAAVGSPGSGSGAAVGSPGSGIGVAVAAAGSAAGGCAMVASCAVMMALLMIIRPVANMVAVLLRVICEFPTCDSKITD